MKIQRTSKIYSCCLLHVSLLLLFFFYCALIHGFADWNVLPVLPMLFAVFIAFHSTIELICALTTLLNRLSRVAALTATTVRLVVSALYRRSSSRLFWQLTAPFSLPVTETSARRFSNQSSLELSKRLDAPATRLSRYLSISNSFWAAFEEQWCYAP